MTLSCTTQTALSQRHVGMTNPPSARLYQCVRCSCQTIISRCCDRGNVYCSQCSAPARREARQRTARRYQQSPQGRSKHAERQRRYREKLRLATEKVTHQGSSAAVNVIPVPERSPVSQYPPETSVQYPESTLFCHCCATVCSQSLRRDFLHLIRNPSLH